MARRDAEELVEVERRRAREIELRVRVQPAELVIEANGRAAGRQPEDQVWFGDHRLRDVRRQCPGEDPLVFEDRDAHLVGLVLWKLERAARFREGKADGAAGGFF